MNALGRDALMIASMRGHEAAVEELLSAGMRSGPKDIKKLSAIELARKGGHQGIVDMLQSTALVQVENQKIGARASSWPWSGLWCAPPAAGMALRASVWTCKAKVVKTNVSKVLPSLSWTLLPQFFKNPLFRLAAYVFFWLPSLGGAQRFAEIRLVFPHGIFSADVQMASFVRRRTKVLENFTETLHLFFHHSNYSCYHVVSFRWKHGL